MSTLYASFLNPSMAEKAAGALLDHGAAQEDISIVANESYATQRVTGDGMDNKHSEDSAKSGISVTTAGDAALGAAKGTMAGIGLGILAAVAAITLPGVGLIIGGGAMAGALAAAGATAGAGAVAGGVIGYLKDQGVDDQMLSHYSNTFVSGGSILAVAVPTGTLSAIEVETYLVKYGAENIATYNAARSAITGPVTVHQEPLVVGNANIDPIAINVAEPIATPVAAVTPPTDHVVTVTQTGEFVDPLTGQTINAVGTPDSSPMVTPYEPITLAPNLRIRPTLVDPISGLVQEGVVIDPLTGLERPVRNSNGQLVYTDISLPTPTYVVDSYGQILGVPTIVQPSPINPSVTVL